MTRLYLQIYVAFVAVVLVSVGFALVVASVGFGRPLVSHAEEGVRIAVAVEQLDDASLPAGLRALSAEVGQDLSVYTPDGELVATTKRRVPFGRVGLLRGREAVGMRLILPDGRVVALGGRADGTRRSVVVVWFVLLALGLALGCYPIARRITSRLERVEAGMRRWGDGEFDARVPVSGRDEVASVAIAFNDAASRVERLIDAQRRVLASASHELRAPLTRLRMALELIGGDAPDETVQRSVADVEELDRTVGDLLQVGRMQAIGSPTDPQPVDLLALAAEEAAAREIEVRGSSSWVRAEPRLVRRMIRNLVENASRHGRPPVEIAVGPGRLAVLDRGDGVPEELRERIFEPFFRPAGHDEGRDGGVGLGLHLVREIATFHGGTARVEAREGGGASFVVELPVIPS